MYPLKKDVIAITSSCIYRIAKKDFILLPQQIFMEILLELLKYTVPALVVLLAAYIIVNKFLISEMQRRQMALFQDTQNITLPLRLQAYERLAIFIERLHPRQLIPRIYQP